MHEDDEGYDGPEIIDYGSLSAMTEATGFTDDEDGGSKFALHHLPPPSQPVN